MISLFLYLSVIITPDGQVKAHSEVLQECPTTEYVMEWHESLVESGEIADWRASCNRYSFDMPELPAEELQT